MCVATGFYEGIDVFAKDCIVTSGIENWRMVVVVSRDFDLNFCYIFRRVVLWVVLNKWNFCVESTAGNFYVDWKLSGMLSDDNCSILCSSTTVVWCAFIWVTRATIESTTSNFERASAKLKRNVATSNGAARNLSNAVWLWSVNCRSVRSERATSDSKLGVSSLTAATDGTVAAHAESIARNSTAINSNFRILKAHNTGTAIAWVSRIRSGSNKSAAVHREFCASCSKTDSAVFVRVGFNSSASHNEFGISIAGNAIVGCRVNSAAADGHVFAVIKDCDRVCLNAAARNIERTGCAVLNCDSVRFIRLNETARDIGLTGIDNRIVVSRNYIAAFDIDFACRLFVGSCSISENVAFALNGAAFEIKDTVAIDINEICTSARTDDFAGLVARKVFYGSITANFKILRTSVKSMAIEVKNKTISHRKHGRQSNIRIEAIIASLTTCTG